jgi:hypothetical protein
LTDRNVCVSEPEEAASEDVTDGDVMVNRTEQKKVQGTRTHKALL